MACTEAIHLAIKQAQAAEDSLKGTRGCGDFAARSGDAGSKIADAIQLLRQAQKELRLEAKVAARYALARDGWPG